MRPNTGVEGCNLVIPDVETCPLCGRSWTGRGVTSGLRWDLENATPSAIQVGQEDGGILSAALVWTCDRCGYQHIHQDS